MTAQPSHRPSGVTSQNNKETSSEHHTFMGMNDSRDRFNTHVPGATSNPSNASGTIEPVLVNTLNAYRSSLPAQPDNSQRFMQQKLSHASLKAAARGNGIQTSHSSNRINSMGPQKKRSSMDVNANVQKEDSTCERGSGSALYLAGTKDNIIQN